MKLHKNKSKQQKELSILKLAIDEVKKTAGIKAKIIKVEDNPIEVNMADAIVEIELAGVIYPYIVEIKSIDRFETLGQIRNQFDMFKTSGLLVAPRISKLMADRCRELDIQFIDTNGNAFLRAADSYVFIKGQQSKDQEIFDKIKKNGFRSNTATGLKVLYALLSKHELLNASFREIALEAGVALGNIGLVFDDLHSRGYTVGEKNKGNRRIIDRKRLIDEWVTNYPIKLRQKLNRNRFHSTNPEWWQTVDIKKYDAQWGGEVAADMLTNSLRPSNVTIYFNSENMQKNVSKIVSENKLQRDPNGEIEIVEAFWNGSANNTKADTVPLLIIYADLLATMDPRNFEIANKIYEERIHDSKNIS